MMECAGVDSGAKMLVVSDVSALPTAERVSGIRRHAATQNIHPVPNFSNSRCKMRFTLFFQNALVWTSDTTAKGRHLSTKRRIQQKETEKCNRLILSSGCAFL